MATELLQFTCTDVMEPFLVVVILSCIVPISVARVGWYPTADGIRPNRADTCKKRETRVLCLAFQFHDQYTKHPGKDIILSTSCGRLKLTYFCLIFSSNETSLGYFDKS